MAQWLRDLAGLAEDPSPWDQFLAPMCQLPTVSNFSSRGLAILFWPLASSHAHDCLDVETGGTLLHVKTVKKLHILLIRLKENYELKAIFKH